MILSGRDVEWYIESGKLKIDPILREQFQQNGVDFILDSTNYELDHVSPGCFMLGSTREWIEMPDDLMAFVGLRSTWARKGFLIPPTIVDAGFRGTLTLEIVSYCHNQIPLGQRFAHLIFAKLTSPSEPYHGKYQNQHGVTPAIMDEI